jgi:hypothetical protein
MNPETKSSLKTFLIELAVYAVLVLGYFLLVLRFLDVWLRELYESDRRVYAAVALGLIVCQGIVLEVLTRGLLAFIKPRGRTG